MLETAKGMNQLGMAGTEELQQPQSSRNTGEKGKFSNKTAKVKSADPGPQFTTPLRSPKQGTLSLTPLKSSSGHKHQNYLLHEVREKRDQQGLDTEGTARNKGKPPESETRANSEAKRFEPP